MALFGDKKKRVIEVGGQKIELEPKPSKGLFGGGKPKQPKPPKQEKMPSMPQPSRPQPQPKQQPQPPQSPQRSSLSFGDLSMPKLLSRPKEKEDKGPIGAASGMGKLPESSVAESKEVTLPKPKGFSFIKPKEKPEGLSLSGVAPAKPKFEIPQLLKSPTPQGRGKTPQIIGAPTMPGEELAAPRPLKPNAFNNYIVKIERKQKGLAAALREQGVKGDVYSFIRRMLIASIMVSVVVAIGVFVVFNAIGLSTIEALLFAAVLGFGIYQTAFINFLKYPLAKGSKSSKNVERDILFAARDMVISLRSGMPLFNVITSASKGYGDASEEFSKIVERVQLGMPLEEAIDETIAISKSPSFRRIMLQASVSIKAGADVVSALQSIIDQLSQERIIELRSYGQKLNAIAMFYMLFGVIMPSMGIAVITILTTFISIFTVDTTVLEFVLVGILSLQIIFLRIIGASRPVFSM